MRPQAAVLLQAESCRIAPSRRYPADAAFGAGSLSLFLSSFFVSPSLLSSPAPISLQRFPSLGPSWRRWLVGSGAAALVRRSWPILTRQKWGARGKQRSVDGWY